MRQLPLFQLEDGHVVCIEHRRNEESRPRSQEARQILHDLPDSTLMNILTKDHDAHDTAAELLGRASHCFLPMDTAEGYGERKVLWVRHALVDMRPPLLLLLLSVLPRALRYLSRDRECETHGEAGDHCTDVVRSAHA